MVIFTKIFQWLFLVELILSLLIIFNKRLRNKLGKFLSEKSDSVKYKEKKIDRSKESGCSYPNIIRDSGSYQSEINQGIDKQHNSNNQSNIFINPFDERANSFEKIPDVIPKRPGIFTHNNPLIKYVKRIISGEKDGINQKRT